MKNFWKKIFRSSRKFGWKINWEISKETENVIVWLDSDISMEIPPEHKEAVVRMIGQANEIELDKSIER